MGFLNGLAITRLGVNPFVVTLGMMSIARGLAYWVSGRTLVGLPRRLRPGWVTALQTARSRLPFAFQPRRLDHSGCWRLVVAVLLRLTVFGRHCYAVGSSEIDGPPLPASTSIGRSCSSIRFAGLLTGWAGILVFAQSGSGNPNSSVGLELDVIAAVVIGGASLGGGQGTVGGTRCWAC